AGLFEQNSFDFILADYLVGEIDCFTPSAQFPVLSNIHRWLRPGGELLIVDTEPLAKGSNSENSPAQELMFWGQMIPVLARRWDEKPRDYSSQLVSSWLDAIGFDEIRIAESKRELDASWAESTYQAFIRQLALLDDEGMREAIKRRLDAVMTTIKRIQHLHRRPIIQDNYSIRASKSPE
ncbi:class I SAM-dependent methyltransferase, partial [bacterium]|nr:class I SAM-dependent methyltransferase [bacterium]